jgi:hypothetical protein
MASHAVEPQLGAESFSCPHCNAFAHQDWYRVFISGFSGKDKLLVFRYEEISHEKVTGLEDNEERKRIEQFAERLAKNFITYRHRRHSEYLSAQMVNLCLSHCYSCKGFAAWVGDSLAYPVKDSVIIAHEDMPAPIREDFDEAAAIVNRSPRGVAALLRLCIQNLMPLLGEKGENINEDIASLVSKGLESEVQQAMDVLRVIGNNAVHPGQMDLKDDKAIAVRLFELLNMIIERCITTPKRIASLYGTLPESALKAIATRDKIEE